MSRVKVDRWWMSSRDSGFIAFVETSWRRLRSVINEAVAGASLARGTLINFLLNFSLTLPSMSRGKCLRKEIYRLVDASLVLSRSKACWEMQFLELRVNLNYSAFRLIILRFIDQQHKTWSISWPNSFRKSIVKWRITIQDINSVFKLSAVSHSTTWS